jgi:dihydroflavonol-4-reductase
MIAVTGANGLLGSFIVRKLIHENEKFVAIKRKDSDTSLLNDVSGKITWIDADVLDPVSLSEALKNVTEVIHTAAIVSFNPRKAKYVLRINVEGTRNVVDACLGLGIKRLVHISSVAALGRQKNQKFINEKNQWVESSLNSVYAESKYLAELEIFRGQEEGLSTVVLNPSVILAPADWNKSSAQLFKYVWQGKPFYTDGFLNYVDVRDVATISYSLLKSNVQRERFIISAGNISYKNFFEQIAAKFNKKAPSIKINKRGLEIIARFEGLRTWFIGSEPLITRETARFADSEFLYNNEKIKKTLSFDFQSFDQSMTWCCQYYMTKI